MLPSRLAIASLRQTSWLRRQTAVHRSEISGARHCAVVVTMKLPAPVRTCDMV